MEMEKNITVTIIEDTRRDVQRASRVLERLGIKNPIVFSLIPAALMYLEDVVSGARAVPDVILLDLEFGGDSGFEVLRFYKTHPKLRGCKVIVWTVMGDTEQELCKLFGVEHFVSKDNTDAVLLSAFKDASNNSSSNAI